MSRRPGYAPFGLRARIIALALVPTVVLAMLLGYIVIQQRASDLEQRIIERGQLLSRQLAAASDFGVFSGNQRTLQALADAVALESAVRSARLIDPQGRPLVVSGQPPAPHLQSHPPAPPWIPLGPTANAWAAKGEGWLAYAHPVLSPRVIDEDWLQAGNNGAAPNTPRGLTAYAVVEMGTTSIAYELQEFAVLVTALLAVVLAGAGWVAQGLSARLVRPVNAMADAVRQVADARKGVRVQGHSGIQTLDDLASGFNNMADQLDRSREQLEERVRQATLELQAGKEAAERADQAKTRFLAAASHDLRQPMHALSMFVSALEHEPDADRQAQLLSRISTATQSMGDLLDSLLDISKLDADAIQAQLGPVALKPLLMRLTATYSELAAGRHIEVVLRTKAHWVLSDAVLLERMIGNLVSNAIRYTVGDGSGKVMIAVRRAGRDLRIEVRDNGPGIPEDMQEAVFEEFMQLDNPERDRSKGLGLGLAIVRRLGRILRHPVGLRSRPGAGSTFSITVPLTLPPPQPRQADRPATPGFPATLANRSLQGRRVLVVDDDALVRESLAQLVSLWGAEVFESSGDGDVTGAIAQAGWWPDLVLTDYRLRGPRDGIALLRELQAQSQAQGRTLMGVVITGDTEQASLQRSGASGLQVLYKPVRAPELRQVIDSLVARLGQ